jgi:putative SOS response-associated peptidase YedK
MCGRYGRRSDKQDIAEHYALRHKVSDLPPAPPGYNITPGTFQPVVRLNEETDDREMVLMEWGLVPYWSNMHKMISNCARDDKLTGGGAWIKPFQQRRCLIPGEFFYEWEVLTPEEKKRKVTKPWAVALKDDRLFSFGGIWDRWKDRSTGNVLESFAIVTVDPNEVLEPFHNRCPLIIEPKDYSRWLAPAEPSHLPIDLVRTYPAEGMKAWRVAPLKDDGQQLLEPLTPSDAMQVTPSLFPE